MVRRTIHTIVNAFENADTTANHFRGNMSVTGTDDGSRLGIPKDVTDTFDWRIQNNETIVATPVVAEGLQSSHGVTTVGFVEVQPIEASGHSGNLGGQVKLLGDVLLGSGVGSSGDPQRATSPHLGARAITTPSL